MPLRITYTAPSFDTPLTRGDHLIAKETARLSLFTATIKRERRDLKAMSDAHWDMINAAEIRLDNLWDVLKKRHPEGVELSLVLRYLWSSFEGDVRYLCDHVMEDYPTDKECMAHAAGSAMIGLRSIIMACIRSPDQPFDVIAMLKFIADYSDGFKSQDPYKETPDPKQAWGDPVSKHG